VRVQECELTGILSQRVPIDLVGKIEAEARELLLAGLKTGRAKPSTASRFPSTGGSAVSHTQTQKPTFPGETTRSEQYRIAKKGDPTISMQGFDLSK
jgi:hypothetical protein